MELTDIPRRVSLVADRADDGEAVLVHPGRGKVTVLNSVGARLWELTDGRRSVAEMARMVAAEYEVGLGKAETDALAFCSDLIDRGLLTLE